MPTWWNNVIYWSFCSSTCFRYIRPSSGALDVKLQRMVFYTEFLDGWWSWEPLRRSCARCGWCRARHLPAKKTSINCTVASNWYFTLFHDEDARSNIPQILLFVSWNDYVTSTPKVPYYNGINCFARCLGWLLCTFGFSDGYVQFTSWLMSKQFTSWLMSTIYKLAYVYTIYKLAYV